MKNQTAAECRGYVKKNGKKKMRGPALAGLPPQLRFFIICNFDYRPVISLIFKSVIIHYFVVISDINSLFCQF